jgi:hypothetical protein
MSKNTASTRRMFLKGGALLAAPMTAASVSAVALADSGSSDGGLEVRLARLQDEAEIRELHQSWLRRINAGEGGELLDGAVRRITADHSGAPEKIEIAADGRRAVGTFDYAVELETPLPEDSTLAQMARAQGHGAVRRTERRMVIVDYDKTRDGWKIGRVALRES